MVWLSQRVSPGPGCASAVSSAPVCSWLQLPDNRPTGGREAAVAAAACSETPIAFGG
jgi:hypothetical protein